MFKEYSDDTQTTSRLLVSVLLVAAIIAWQRLEERKRANHVLPLCAGDNYSCRSAPRHKGSESVARGPLKRAAEQGHNKVPALLLRRPHTRPHSVQPVAKFLCDLAQPQSLTPESRNIRRALVCKIETMRAAWAYNSELGLAHAALPTVTVLAANLSLLSLREFWGHRQKATSQTPMTSRQPS